METKHYYTEKYRPQYHFSPETKWTNDPCALVYYEGEYHLLYQYHPASTIWGPMHFGHAVSQDLVHWEHRPIALAPDHNGFIYTGSAVVDKNDTTGFFNGGSGMVIIFCHSDKYPGTERQRQRISLAYSNDKGRSWLTFDNNPVLADADFTDFRDPKVFWHEESDKWVLVLAAGDAVRIYSSTNLREWSFESEFGKEEGSHDGVWECPDLFCLSVDGDEHNKKWVLIVSIGDPKGSRTQYFIGDFDGSRFKNENSADLALWLDYGMDNYAAQSWSDIPSEDGRRIYIGWMSNWIYARNVPTEVWRGAMTLPRELSLIGTEKGIRVKQVPVRELETLRQSQSEWRQVEIKPQENRPILTSGDKLELIAEFNNDDAVEFGFIVRKSDSEETKIGYDRSSNEIFIDRTKSGESDFHSDFAGRHAAPIFNTNDRLKLHIFLDWSSVEVFGNEGEASITDLIFPRGDSNNIEIYARGGTARLEKLTIHVLKSIWRECN